MGKKSRRRQDRMDASDRRSNPGYTSHIDSIQGVRGLPFDPTRGAQLRAMSFPAYKLTLVADVSDTPPFWTVGTARDFEAGVRLPLAAELLAWGILPEEAQDGMQWVTIQAVETKNAGGPPYPTSPTELRIRRDVIEYICAENPFQDLQRIPRICKQTLLHLCHRESDFEEVQTYTFS